MILKMSPSYNDLALNESQIGNSTEQNQEVINQRSLMFRQKGLHLPNFYFSFSSLNSPGHLGDLENVPLKQWLDRMGKMGYKGQELGNYVLSFQQFLISPSTMRNREVQIELKKVFLKNTLVDHQEFWRSMQEQQVDDKGVRQSFERIFASGTTWERFVPSFHFHPMNQYHRWLFGDGDQSNGALFGDFGRSSVSRKPIIQHIARSLPWSLTLSFLAIGIMVLFSSVFGVAMAYFQSSFYDRLSSGLLFVLFVIPSFWMATLLLYFFTNPDYFNWFPPGGVMPIERFITHPTVFERIWVSWPYLVLPLICYVYNDFSFTTKSVRLAAVDSLKSLYVFSARARGLSTRSVLFKHVLKNSLLPLITISGGFLPALFSGSLVIENIFAIPGMGKELYHGILNGDINMVMAIFLISGVLGVLGFLVSDILYSYADPRIKLDEV